MSFTIGIDVGGTFTDIVVASPDVIAQTPLGRIGQPDDIGPVAVFLASADSGWVTGQTLLVAGGNL